MRSFVSAALRAGLFAGSILAFGSGAARAAPPEVRPILVGETDLRFHAADRVEGENGFAVARLRLGVLANITSWLTAVGQAEWAKEKPSLLDAYAELRPPGGWAVRIGAGKNSLFASAHDDEIYMLPVPELSMVARAFWPGRDAGVEVHKVATRALPLDAWLRVGNGSGAVLGNDNSDFALQARLDVALGRALPGEPASLPFGARLGAGIHVDSVEDRPGVAGSTADDFIFYRPPSVTGPRRVVEAHVVGYLGPIRLLAEGAIAHESRAKDTDGNPKTARVAQAETQSSGGSFEVAWMITGQHRSAGEWPVAAPWNEWTWGAVEVAGRVERLDLGRGARDVEPGGATSGAGAVRWWATSFAALSGAFYFVAYDKPPIEEPERKDTWLALARLTMRAP